MGLLRKSNVIDKVIVCGYLLSIVRFDLFCIFSGLCFLIYSV